MTMIPAWVDNELTPVEKLEVHRRGLKHKAVSVFAVDGTRTLIQKRAAGKYHSPGLWANTCCTHPMWNEQADACALRRLGEELGIHGSAVDFRQRVEYRANVEPDLIEDEVVDIFVTELSANQTLSLNPAEVEAVKWIELDALRDQVRREPAKFSVWLRIYLAEHFEGLRLDCARNEQAK